MKRNFKKEFLKDFPLYVYTVIFHFHSFHGIRYRHHNHILPAGTMMFLEFLLTDIHHLRQFPVTPVIFF